MAMVRLALLTIVGFVVGAATGCGSNRPAVPDRPAAAVASLVGPHCAANEAARAREQEAQQQSPALSQPPAPVSAFPPPLADYRFATSDPDTDADRDTRLRCGRDAEPRRDGTVAVSVISIHGACRYGD